MNKATILVSAVLGLFLGTSIGIAQASDAPVGPPVIEVPAAHVEVTENIVLMKEVTITVPRKSLHAAARVPSKPAKELVCTPFKDLTQGYGQVKTCEWK